MSSALWEAAFGQMAEALQSHLTGEEQAQLRLTAEESQFTRFNRGRVRQTGQVRDGQLQLTLMAGHRTCDRSIPFTGDKDTDWPCLKAGLESAREELPQLPEDPFQVVPEGAATSHDQYGGLLLEPTAVAAAVLTPLGDMDFAGFYSGGRCVRAYADSAGQLHWFETETFALDYSLFTSDGQAVKGIFAGDRWEMAAYHRQLEQSKEFFSRMQQPPKNVPRGSYRTYLAPAAVADLISMLSWGGISEAALRRSGGALRALQQGEKLLSPKLNLRENFRHGAVPRFNCWGEMAPMELSLIEAGRLQQTLVSSRTAREYEMPSNCAEAGEHLRSPEICPGQISEADILKTLDTGLYLSNLHYLNWSDRPQGRITGMTRYACFWVEQGEIVAPIANLRFDESLYRFWGSNLVDFTDQVVFIPEVGTYGYRDLGGIWTPGMIVEDFTYTL